MRSKEEEKVLVDLIAKYENLIKAKAASCLTKAARHDAALSFDDLFQAGVGGLIEAFDSFNPSLGVPLQAYIALKINYAVYNEYSRCSQLSKHFHSIKRQMESDTAVLEKIYGRAVSDEELADFLSISVETLEDKIAEVHAATPDILQFSSLPGHMEELLLEDYDYESVEEQVYRIELSTKMQTALQCLHPRERIILHALFTEGKSLEEAGLQLGISKQRAWILRDRALILLKLQMGED